MTKLTIDTRDQVTEFFDTIVAWSLKETYDVLCSNIKYRPACGMWVKNKKKDIAIAKEYSKALEMVMDMYGVEYEKGGA